MNGEFKRSFRTYILAFILALSGAILAIRFSIWGVQEVLLGRMAACLFCCTFALLGATLVVLSIFILHFNQNASLFVSDDSLHAQFSWKRVVHVDLKNVTNATRYGNNLKLYTYDDIAWIYGLTNAKEICEYLLSRIERRGFTVDIETARHRYQKSKKAFICYLAITVFVCALLFINIGWCVCLTEGTELDSFSKSDDLVFLAFAFAEIFTFVLAFFLANKCGKALDNLNMFKSHILSAAAQEHMNEGLDQYHNVITKRYLDNYAHRIVIFSPYEEIFAYMLERFDIKTLAWLPCYERAVTFDLLSELYDVLDQIFEGSIIDEPSNY